MLILAAAFLAAGWLRLEELGRQSFGYDEAYFYQIVSGSLTGLLQEVQRGHSSPPLFPLLLRLNLLLGDSERILRLLPAACGLCGVAAMYFLARRFLSRNAAAAAALLAAVASPLVFQGREVRETAAVFTMSCLITLAAVVYSRVTSRRLAWISTGLQLAGLFLHYSLILLAAGLHLYVLLHARRRGRMPELLMIWIPAHLALIPAGAAVYWYFFRQQFYMARGREYLFGYWDGSFGGLASLALRNTVQMWSFTLGVWPVLSLCLVLLGISAWAKHQRLPRNPLVLAAAVYGIYFLAALLNVYPYVDYRHCLFAAPMLYVLTASGLKLGGGGPLLDAGRGLAVVLLAALMAYNAFEFSRAPGGEEMRPVYQKLAEAYAPGDRIFVTPGAVYQFRYYNRMRQLPAWEGSANPGYLTGHNTEVSRVDVLAYVPELTRELAGQKRLWVVYSHQHATEPGAAEVLRAIRAPRRARFVWQHAQAALLLAE